jgi:hypothetical protein
MGPAGVGTGLTLAGLTLAGLTLAGLTLAGLTLAVLVCAGACSGGPAAAPAAAPIPGGSPAPPAVPGLPCPEDAVLADLHTALWQAERLGASVEAAARVAAARRRLAVEASRGGSDGGWPELAAHLAEVLAREPLEIFELEELRARLHESPCLRPDLHERLHAALEAVAGFEFPDTTQTAPPPR